MKENKMINTFSPKNIWAAIKDLLKGKALRRRSESLKHADGIIAAILSSPERGHFVGARITRDGEMFAEMLAERKVLNVRIATLDPGGKDNKVSYVTGINLINSREIQVLVGTTSVFATGWRSDGALNSIHCLHDLRDSNTETQYLGRMKRGHGVGSNRTNFVNGELK